MMVDRQMMRRGNGVWRGRHGRRGIAMVIVIALFAICLTLFGLWARQIVDEQRRLTSQQNRMQAIRLAEAGVLRARTQLASDLTFTKDNWSVPASMLGGTHSGDVRIRVHPADESGSARCEVIAEYPADVLRRAQITRQFAVRPSGSENAR